MNELKVALKSFVWISIIGTILFILNFQFYGTDDILIVLVIMVISLLVLIYYAVKYLIELGKEVEELKKKQ
jgi:hypothetical protein